VCSGLLKPYTGSILFSASAAFMSHTARHMVLSQHYYTSLPAYVVELSLPVSALDLERLWNLCDCCTIFLMCASTTGSTIFTAEGLSAEIPMASAISCNHCSSSADMVASAVVVESYAPLLSCTNSCRG
jgi:hypothetical protein